MSFETAIDLMHAADSKAVIAHLASYAGTHNRPSMSLLLSARAALLREGWVRVENGWRSPEPYTSAWETYKGEVLRGTRQIYKRTAEGRTSDETYLIMACRARTMLRNILDAPEEDRDIFSDVDL